MIPEGEGYCSALEEYSSVFSCQSLIPVLGGYRSPFLCLYKLEFPLNDLYSGLQILYIGAVGEWLGFGHASPSTVHVESEAAGASLLLVWVEPTSNLVL